VLGRFLGGLAGGELAVLGEGVIVIALAPLQVALGLAVVTAWRATAIIRR